MCQSELVEVMKANSGVWFTRHDFNMLRINVQSVQSGMKRLERSNLPNIESKIIIMVRGGIPYNVRAMRYKEVLE